MNIIYNQIHRNNFHTPNAYLLISSFQLKDLYNCKTVVFANDMFELGCQLFSEIDFVTEGLEKKMPIY